MNPVKSDYQQLIESIAEEVMPLFGKGKVADYIPALSNVNPHQFGMTVATVDGTTYSVGDYDVKFSIQSISKVFTLAMAMSAIGDELWKCVGREPSGTAFNSLVQLETENGKPRNPFINAGAIAVTDKVMTHFPRPKDELLSMVRAAADSGDIYFDANVARSEFEHSDRNMALGYFMRSFGIIENDVEMLMDIYCHQCSISMTCEELAKSFLFLANGGVNIFTGCEVLSPRLAKRLNALMLTCGFYDESGEFAFRVGIPGKSGVGGGVAAVIPGRLSVAVWSPELDTHGNSVIGVAALEQLTTALGKSIF